HPGGLQGIINDEALFPNRIVRGANLPGDEPGWAGPINLIDSSAMNLSRTELEAWDVQLDLSKETTGYGAFDLFLMGTWQPHYKTQTVAGATILDLAGIGSGNPLKLKVNGGLVWRHRGWQAGWSVNYFDSYKVSTFY